TPKHNYAPPSPSSPKPTTAATAPTTANSPTTNSNKSEPPSTHTSSRRQNTARNPSANPTRQNQRAHDDTHTLHKFHTAAFPHSSAICACVRDPPDRAPRLLKPLLYPLSYGDREFRKLLHVQARLPHGSQLGPAGRQDVRRPQRSSAVAASSSAPNQVGIVWGLVRGNEVGWGSVQIVGAIVAGLLLLA